MTIMSQMIQCRVPSAKKSSPVTRPFRPGSTRPCWQDFPSQGQLLASVLTPTRINNSGYQLLSEAGFLSSVLILPESTQAQKG